MLDVKCHVQEVAVQDAELPSRAGGALTRPGTEEEEEEEEEVG